MDQLQMTAKNMVRKSKHFKTEISQNNKLLEVWVDFR